MRLMIAAPADDPAAIKQAAHGSQHGSIRAVCLKQKPRCPQLIAAAEPDASGAFQNRQKGLIRAVCPAVSADKIGLLGQRQQGDLPNARFQQQLAIGGKAVFRVAAGADR